MWGLPSGRMDAGVVYDHLNGKSIVDIHEEGVGIVIVQTTQVHLGNTLYEGSVVPILTASKEVNSQHIDMGLPAHLIAS